MPHELRPYQARAIDELRSNFIAGSRRQLLVAPTGAGKTTIAAAVIEGARKKGKRIWFLAHRRELIDQCSKRLDDHGIDHGVIQGSHPRRKLKSPVQVVSVQTIVRGKRLETSEPPDLIIVDEAHRSLASSYLAVVHSFPEAAAIGLTATPWRLDGKPLGDRYEKMVLVATPQELIDTGFLLAPRVFAPSTPDLSGVRKTAGDYRLDDLSERMRTATIVGDVVRHWRTHVASSSNPLTVLFGVNKEHSLLMRDRFRDAGVQAEHIDESTPGSERARILKDLASGQVKIVTNCQILTEGWDLPHLGCVQLLRPTKSLSLYLQMAGRGMRVSAGKVSWVLLDHAGCVPEHGFPQSQREYSLDVEARPKRKPAEKEDGPAVTICAACFAAYLSSAKVCPECGTVRAPTRRKIEEDRDGSLEEVSMAALDAIRAKAARKVPWTDRVRALASLITEAQERGYKPGWALMRFKEKVGQWPPKPMQAQARAIVERLGE